MFHMRLKAAVLGIVFGIAASVVACAQWSNSPTKSPRTKDGRPDLSGVWLNADFRPEGGLSVRLEKALGFNLARDLSAGEAPLQPWAKAIAQQRENNLQADDPLARCLPAGVPRIETSAPFKIVAAPAVTIMLLEGPYPMSTFRQIFTDGRPLPKDPQPTWLGYSVGHWDDATLVVDTTGFNGRAWLDDKGLPQSDALHVIERFRRPDIGHLEVRITIDDAKVYTELWSARMIANLLPDGDLIEAVCENEKDVAHLPRK